MKFRIGRKCKKELKKSVWVDKDGNKRKPYTNQKDYNDWKRGSLNIWSIIPPGI